MRYNYNYKNGDGQYAPSVLTLPDGRKVINPSEEMYAAAGYLAWQPAEPSDEDLARMSIEKEIETLRGEIGKIDWKITKTSEYRLVGLPDPYDTMELHNERQALRDRINELEKIMIKG